MINEIIFRKGESQDFPFLLEVQQEIMGSLAWSESGLKSEFSKPYSKILIAEAHGRIIGLLIYWEIFKEIELLNVGVHPDFRRRGVGRGLIQMLLRESEEGRARKIILDVGVQNAAALSLYEKLGFVTLNEKKAFYSDGKSAYSMIRVIERADPLESL